jgi:hypothetical protein
MRQIRASFTESTIRVYQAYCHEIADKAVQAQAFVSPFKRERMTWIKPSFLWMMYRSDWGIRPRQERILAVDISRSGFEWALAHACLTHYDPSVYASQEDWLLTKAKSPVRVQFDPDRSPTMEPLDLRAIQVGLSGEAVQQYTHEWVTKITDITGFVHDLHELVRAGQPDIYNPLLPKETLYPVSPDIGSCIGITAVVGRAVGLFR